MADGTYEGNVVTHNFDGKTTSHTISIDPTYTFIGEIGGIKYAQIEVLQHHSPSEAHPEGNNFRARLIFKDYDEPGKNDYFLMIVAWADIFGIPPGPPNWPFWGDWAGSDYILGGGLPNGNVQIHLTDAYYDN